MAYDEELADRLRELVEGSAGLSEKKMFGGIAFLINGNMAVAASSKGGIMVRVDPAESESLLEGEHVSRMVMSGRPMDGWLRVAEDALAERDELKRWADIGTAYARSLPPK